MLYKPQVGPEHRKLIERHKRVRENLADPFLEPIGFASRVPEKPVENQAKEPEKPAEKRKGATLSWEDIVHAASAVLSSGKITIGDVIKPYKDLDIVEGRSIVVYLMHQDLKLGGAPMSFVEIGKTARRKNERDHAPCVEEDQRTSGNGRGLTDYSRKDPNYVHLGRALSGSQVRTLSCDPLFGL